MATTQPQPGLRRPANEGGRANVRHAGDLSDGFKSPSQKGVVRARPPRRVEYPTTPRALFETQERRPSAPGPQYWLEKSFIIFGFIVGTFLSLVFFLDLSFGWPLQRASLTFDTSSVICGVILVYLSWHVLRSQISRRLWKAN